MGFTISILDWYSQKYKKCRDKCSRCSRQAPSKQGEPLTCSPLSKRSLQKTHINYFSIKNTPTQLWPTLSGWLCIYHFKQNQKASTELIDLCCDIFTTYGIPEKTNTDRGIQLNAWRNWCRNSVFQNFLKQYKSRHDSNLLPTPPPPPPSLMGELNLL